MNAEAYIALIRKQIKGDSLDDALMSLYKLLTNSPMIDEVIMQSGRFEALKKQVRIGTLDPNTATIERNKIRNALIEFTKELKESAQKNVKLREELTQHAATINQNHSGSGDNVGGDKTINIYGISLRTFLIILGISIISIVIINWNNKQKENTSLVIVNHVKDTVSTTLSGMINGGIIGNKQGSAPIHTFILLNRNSFPLVIKGIAIDIPKFDPRLSGDMPRTREIEPMSIWEIVLPSEEGYYIYNPKKGIYIAPNDAVSLPLRFIRNKSIRDTGALELSYLRIKFLTDNDKIFAKSETFKIF